MWKNEIRFDYISKEDPAKSLLIAKSAFSSELSHVSGAVKVGMISIDAEKVCIKTISTEEKKVIWDPLQLKQVVNIIVP